MRKEQAVSTHGRRDVAFLFIRRTGEDRDSQAGSRSVRLLLLVRLLAAAFYGVESFDPASFATALALLVSVGLVASWQPVQRTMRVDPAVVLRDE